MEPGRTKSISNPVTVSVRVNTIRYQTQEQMLRYLTHFGVILGSFGTLFEAFLIQNGPQAHPSVPRWAKTEPGGPLGSPKVNFEAFQLHPGNPGSA